MLFGKLINLFSLPFEKLFGPTILSKKLSESLKGKNSPKGTSIFLSKWFTFDLVIVSKLF